jgi:anti-sigma-K factor RskA
VVGVPVVAPRGDQHGAAPVADEVDERRGQLGLVVRDAAVRQPQPVQPPIIVVIAPNPEAAGVLQAGFAAGLTRDGRALVLQPIHPVVPGSGRAFELWAVPPQGAPRSLGLVSGEQATTVQRGLLLRDTAAFAVSLEPSGGSPTGAPTGPILSVGKLQI